MLEAQGKQTHLYMSGSPNNKNLKMESGPNAKEREGVTFSHYHSGLQIIHTFKAIVLLKLYFFLRLHI